MVNKFKKLMVVLLGLLCTFCFGACSAGVDVIEQSDANNWYFEVRVKMDITLNTVMDSTASVKANGATAWTVRDWLVDYFTIISADGGMTVKYNGKKAIDGANNYVFSLTVPKNCGASNLFKLSSQQNSQSNLFLRKYSVNREDRFNPFIQQFNDVYQRFTTGLPTIPDYSSAMGVILLGRREYFADKLQSDAGGNYIYDPLQKCCYTSLLPAFNSAFPYAGKMDNYKNFSLDNYWLASKKMNVQANGKITENGNTFYVFSKTLGDAPGNIAYSYYRAVSAGWYIVSIVAGLLTVGIVYLVCKVKKQKPKDDPPKVVHPIDPFS